METTKLKTIFMLSQYVLCVNTRTLSRGDERFADMSRVMAGNFDPPVTRRARGYDTVAVSPVNCYNVLTLAAEVRKIPKGVLLRV